MSESSDSYVIPSMMRIPESLEDFQSEDQRRVLDAVAHMRKCGLDAILPLPQIVVCGSQSAGKSSVLEALTEIPFPRNDKLCTRFATEITLRRGPTDSLHLGIIPANTRSAEEKEAINTFSETIADFDELPGIMSKAASVMGLDSGSDGSSWTSSSGTIARDVLSFVIEGPSRPQLTVVDVPGLVQNAMKATTEEDKKMVEDITDSYISQERTICLAVIQASDDCANQPILTKVRKVDPKGNRTLGIITKPDKLDRNSGSESEYLALARNETVFFKLGWHVLRNRNFTEVSCSTVERNMHEADFFRTSNFGSLPADCCGVETLRLRLSALLFDHIKRELPTLRSQLDQKLAETTSQLERLGPTRTTAPECRNYLTTISLKFLETTRAASDGHYETVYFQDFAEEEFNPLSPQSAKRLQAAIQHANREFAETMRRQGPKYFISDDNTNEPALDEEIVSEGASNDEYEVKDAEDRAISLNCSEQDHVRRISREEALDWVAQVLVRSRGKEPIGNYNPLIIGELFWEMSSNWKHLADAHIDRVEIICNTFTQTLLEHICPGKVRDSLGITEGLQTRKARAVAELQNLLKDKQDFPTVYNHYYTDNVQKARQTRMGKGLRKAIDSATTHTIRDIHAVVNLNAAVLNLQGCTEQDMEKYSCEEALDCVLSMYKTQQKTFVANVTSQVIGRHMIRELDRLFTPLDVNNLSDKDVIKIASDPLATQREREYLLDRNHKLLSSKNVFKAAMGHAK